MTIQELYLAVDGDYQDAVSRLLKESLVERFVLKFPDDPSYSNLQKAAAEANAEEAFRAAHTLKGVAANLGFTGLQSAASALTEQLRPQTEPADPELLKDVETAYNKVFEGLTAYKNSK